MTALWPVKIEVRVQSATTFKSRVSVLSGLLLFLGLLVSSIIFVFVFLSKNTSTGPASLRTIPRANTTWGKWRMGNGYSSNSGGMNDLHLLGKPFEWKHKKELGDTVLDLKFAWDGEAEDDFTEISHWVKQEVAIAAPSLHESSAELLFTLCGKPCAHALTSSRSPGSQWRLFQIRSSKSDLSNSTFHIQNVKSSNCRVCKLTG